MNFIILALIIPGIDSKYFSTVTPYKSVANLDTRPIFPNNYETAYVRYIGRHGSRFMSKKNIIQTRKLATKFSNPDLKLKYFDFSHDLFDLKMKKTLSERGWDELYSIGRRYMKRFSKNTGKRIFRKINFKFESTCKRRSSNSMKAFIAGMFEGRDKTMIPVGRVIPCEFDTKYRFFDFCDRYKSLHRCLSEFEIEEKRFMNKEIIINITSQINQKLKFNASKKLTPSDLKILYIQCAYDRIVNGIDFNAGTCSLFDEESLQAFDYLLDIKQYYKRGNSHEINIDISCQLFKKIFCDIKKSLNKCNKDYALKHHKLLGTFGFSHAETLLPILGSFGLFDPSHNDENNNHIEINADNFEKLKNNRTFRAGYFSPMGGNLLLAVACPTEDDEEGVVMALLNENPIPLPCCEPKYLNGDHSYPVCSKKEFLNCFTKRAEQCDYFKACSTPYKCKSRFLS